MRLSFTVFPPNVMFFWMPGQGRCSRSQNGSHLQVGHRSSCNFIILSSQSDSQGVFHHTASHFSMLHKTQQRKPSDNASYYARNIWQSK